MVDPGEGYRLLEVGEVVTQGDEWYDRFDQPCVHHVATSPDTLSPGDGYRWLEIGKDVILPDDEVLSNDRKSFTLVSDAVMRIEGQTCCVSNAFRRRVTPPPQQPDIQISGDWEVKISGVYDGQTVTNEHGGKQSFISARFDAIPPIVLRLLAQCLGFGLRKYGKDNWKKIPLEENVAHAQNHLNEWMLGDRSEPHLVNAMARITFALWHAVDSKQQPETYIHPDMKQ